MTELHWLPDDPAWRSRLRALRDGAVGDPDEAWAEAVVLANLRADFVRTNALDGVVRGVFAAGPPAACDHSVVRLAVLGSCTMAHLHGAIRVGGLRRGLWIDIFEAGYGQYWQALVDPGSALHAYRPSVVLLALDAHHLAGGARADMTSEQAADAVAAQTGHVAECWRLARAAFGCAVIQQMPLPVHADLLGQNENRLPGSAAAMIARINAELRAMAAAADRVDVLAVDACAARDGLAAWYDAELWYRAKQEISLAAAPLYGDLVARLIAARIGLSRKCLVLDLDDTLWGGVIGDDGLDGIVLGQGSALGEAFVAFQVYARELSRRGVVLAVCSKNDAAVVTEAFQKHPEMVLGLGDFAAVVANWNDKATNLRAIAAELSLGLDSLLFIDDNPAERALVRRELPMVAVPELPDDPVGFARAIADAGYFEAVGLTGEDRARTALYQGRRANLTLRDTATDMAAYLRGLEMRLVWRRFDNIGLARIVQLINKTNQFNLTTRRYSEDEVVTVMQSPAAFGVQLRLLDRFGDNGIVAVCIGRLQGTEDVLIDTWLMSCRVLGRRVEQATLAVIVEEARKLGAKRLVGVYRPTPKNSMVRDHYENLGFARLAASDDGCTRAVLELKDFLLADAFMTVTEG